VIMIEASPAADHQGPRAWGHATHGRGGDLRRFYPQPPRVDWGIALHARSLSGGLGPQAGELRRHRPLNAAPAPVLKAIAPSRKGLVVAVECLLTWSGLAALGARAGMACVLGHARSMHARPGGTAPNAPREAHTMAAWRRGGRRPPAAVSPGGGPPATG
jgi:hypothetical protein